MHQGHHWYCLANLKADCAIGCTIQGPLTDQFPWGSDLANHRSECVDITGDVQLSHLPIGSLVATIVATIANYQFPLGLDLHQSECIIHGHHWYCLANLKAHWTIGCTIQGRLTGRFPLGSGLANHRSEGVDITGDVQQSYLSIGCSLAKMFVTIVNYRCSWVFHLHQSKYVKRGHH